MSKHGSMQWNLRQVMADRGIFQTTELVPLLAERGIHISREHVYRLVAKTRSDDTAGKSEELGPKLGSIRPIRATVRRPTDD